eukprot:Skav229511  [mRNA]  locus=scaffold842:49654:50280:- [translate_table: standard]
MGRKLGLQWGKCWKELKDHRGKLLEPNAGCMKCEWWHVPPCFFVDDPYRDYTPFAVVRCPYQRVISEFRCPWKGFEAPTGKNEVKKARRRNATAEDLNHWLKRKLMSLADSPPYRNGHFIPQHLYIFDSHGHRYVAEENVLRFEHLDEDLKQFGARHGLDIQLLPRVNESDMPRFSVGDLEATTRSLVESAFEKDFDLLGFQRFAPET